MKQTSADFYDRHSSRKETVQLGFDEMKQMHILGSSHNLVYPLSQLRISARIGNTPRSIYLPNGGKCETLDNDFIDDIVTAHHPFRQLVYQLESKLYFVLLALILTVLITWSWIEFGIPRLAQQVAYALPAATDAALGQGALQIFDQVWFSDSTLEQTVKEQLTADFNHMAQILDDTHTYRLEFRHSDLIGANAFALPSGIIVITDELVELVEHDHELMAIFAHEIGHVVHRHALRQVLQNSAIALVIAAVMGDVFSISSLSATLPTVLIEAKYSRAFETEADDFALTYLKNQAISPKHFANILLRLQQEQGVEEDEATHYLSSHPATHERIKRFVE